MSASPHHEKAVREQQYRQDLWALQASKPAFTRLPRQAAGTSLAALRSGCLTKTGMNPYCCSPATASPFIPLAKMSLKICKAGLLDTVQDGGRYGFQHLGINPGGAMDRFAASLANALLGKKPEAPVIEMHYPAP